MIRPLNDWILVHLDPLSEMCGSLYAPSASRVRRATVLRVGPGKPARNGRVPVDVEPGDRVAFYREHMEHLPARAICKVLRKYGEEELGMVKWPDILVAFTGEVHLQ